MRNNHGAHTHTHGHLQTHTHTHTDTVDSDMTINAHIWLNFCMFSTRI